MSRRGAVTPIGCFASDWRKHVRVTKAVQRELAADPSLVPVVERALDAHGGKLHRILARDGFVHTVAYLRRGKKQNACVIATHCSPDLILGSVVAFSRVVAPR